MGNLLYNQELQLERFAEFLLKQQLVPESKARVYVHWVRKFLGQGIAVPVVSLDDRMAGFLKSMEGDGLYKDWQVAQAEQALRLYFVNFKTDADWSTPAVPTLTSNPDGAFAGMATLEAVRTQLRLKHYSYTTEKTYLDWIRKFFVYLKETGRGTPDGAAHLSPDRVRDYLAYLATRREVAASTQTHLLQLFDHFPRKC